MKVGKACLRAVLLVCSVAVLLGSMAACEKKLDSMPSSEIAQILLHETKLRDMVELSAEQLSLHYDFADGDLQDFSCMISKTADNADEIAVFHLSSGEKADSIVAFISRHLSNRSKGFKDINSAEYEKLQTAVIRKTSDSIILVVCGQNKKVADKLDSLGAVAVAR